MFSSRARIVASRFPVRRISSDPEAIKATMANIPKTLGFRIAKGVAFYLAASFAFVYSFVYFTYSDENTTNFIRSTSPNVDDVTYMYRRGLIKRGYLKPVPGDDEREKKDAL